MSLAPSKVGVTLPPCVVVDMDRTLAIPHPERHPMDATTCDRDGGNWEVVEAVRMYAERYPIVVVSGRQEECREPTERWLAQHGITHVALFMRPNRDGRPDQDLKREIYERDIAPKWKVRVVFDDRNKVVAMWRSLGLTVFQVAEGDF